MAKRISEEEREKVVWMKQWQKIRLWHMPVVHLECAIIALSVKQISAKIYHLQRII